MKKTLIIFLSFLSCIIAFKTYATNSSFHDGWYYSPNQLFSVRIPAGISLNNLKADDVKFNSQDGAESVDFTYDGYWQIAGAYSITWGRATPNIKKNFEKGNAVAPPNFLKYLGHATETIGRMDDNPICGPLKINHHRAYQCVGSGIINNQNAAIVGTAILFNNGTAIVVAMYPKESNESNTKKSIRWNDYNKFISSLKEL